MCDTLVAITVGQVLFGKNSDRQSGEAQLLEFAPRRNYKRGEERRLTYARFGRTEHTHAILISRPWWIWGAEMGSNEFGLTIGNEAVATREPAQLTPGIIGMDYVRLALEAARTVDDAISFLTELLETEGQSGNCGYSNPFAYHNSFMIADADGAKVLETSGRDWAVRNVTGNDAISNSLSIRGDFSAVQIAEVELAERVKVEGFRKVFQDFERCASGEFRRDRVHSLLDKLGHAPQVCDIFAILRDHEEGPTQTGTTGPRICAHASDNPLGQTTASWVASLKPGRAVHWVTGTASPCMSLFKPLTISSSLQGLGSPRGDQDDSSLWWKHEKLRAWLERESETTVQAFTGERDELEQTFIGMVDEAVSSDQSRSALDQIISTCWDMALEFEDRWYGASIR